MTRPYRMRNVSDYRPRLCGVGFVSAVAALALLSSAMDARLFAAPPSSHGRNYEEANVGDYSLPDPLVGKDGRRVADAGDWEKWRRGEILQDFRDLMYGHTPDFPYRVQAEAIAVRPDAIDGLATRTIVRLRFFDDPAAPYVDLMLYVPNAAAGPVPTFLGMNFSSNASIEDDPTIPLTDKWMRPDSSGGVVDHAATEALRGTSSDRWPLKFILSRGYAVATFYYGDIEPDHIDGWRDGIRGYVLRLQGRDERADNEWGALGAWGWGLSRALDYLKTHPEVDADRVVVLGHSRLGKAAFWAGAQDRRFAIVVSNNSGEGGASLARRNFGENIAYSIYHASWRYADRFRDFVDRANELPFDQHMLLALVAPRPVYIASASEDLLADPKGEFLAALNAESIYQLYGLRGIGVSQWPQPEEAVGETVGYHLRRGQHNITRYDWTHYLDFADRHLMKQAEITADE
jgi:hypothetical protein